MLSRYSIFGDWIESALGRSQSTGYAAMRAVTELADGGIGKAEVTALMLTNAIALSKVPRSRRRRLLEAAGRQTEREFMATIDAEIPGLALEENTIVYFTVPRSFVQVIDRCIQKAKALEHTDSRAVAIEAIFSEYDATHTEIEVK